MMTDTEFGNLLERNYIEAQMFQVAPLPIDETNFPYGFDIQVRSPGRKTNWLRITPAQFKKIEDIIRGAV
jgi:hypothetical protein